MKLGDRSFQPFGGVFAQEIFPSIQQDYETLLKSMPSRVETHLGEKEEKFKRRMSKKGEDEEKEKEKKKETENEQKVDPVQAKLLKLLEEVREKEERRNCYLNLAYTAPHENAPLHKDISYEKVATVALDMFVDTSQAVSAPEPKVQAVSAADEEETITPKDKPSLLESIAALPKIPWRIPKKSGARLRNSYLRHGELSRRIRQILPIVYGYCRERGLAGILLGQGGRGGNSCISVTQPHSRLAHGLRVDPRNLAGRTRREEIHVEREQGGEDRTASRIRRP